MNRAKALQIVHVGKRKLGLDDPTYRALLQRVTGKSSAKDLNASQLQAVIAEFKRQGFRIQSTGVYPTDKNKQRNKIRMLWQQMHKDGIVRDPSNKALDIYCQRVTGSAFLEWVHSPQDLNLIIETLKKWQRRKKN